VNFWPYFPLLSILSIFLPRTFHIYSLLSAKSVIDRYVTPFIGCEFCENWFSEDRTLLKGVITISLAATILAQFGRNPIKKMSTKIHAVIVNLVKNPYNGSHNLFRGIM
jgi:hypothetical protein